MWCVLVVSAVAELRRGKAVKIVPSPYIEVYRVSQSTEKVGEGLIF